MLAIDIKITLSNRGYWGLVYIYGSRISEFADKKFRELQGPPVPINWLLLSPLMKWGSTVWLRKAGLDSGALSRLNKSKFIEFPRYFITGQMLNWNCAVQTIRTLKTVIILFLL